jgi:hypothetical protein
MTVRRLLAICILLAAPAAAHAQVQTTLDVQPALTVAQGVRRIKAGIVVKAKDTVLNIVATAPVPMEWPEQQVKIIEEDFAPSYAKIDYRTVTSGGAVKQLVMEIPRLAAGQEARALVTFEVTRLASPALPPDTSLYTIPKKLDRELNVSIGSSPFIESRHPKIVAAAKEAVSDKATDWQKVESIYDWARQHVAHRGEELVGAARALHAEEGSADDLACLFVAMCRSQKIPARTVFVSGGVYAEFYLEDPQGVGRWFPCQTSGDRIFGTTRDDHPILQKGDNFKNPEDRKERLRFVTEYFNASGRGKSPKVTFVSELLDP